MKLARLFAAAAVVSLSALAPAVAHAFTEDEVARGREAFNKCVECHAIAGYPEPVPTPRLRVELSGTRAVDKMHAIVEQPGTNGSVAELTNYILARMPQNKPGSLREDEAIALTAFVLAANGSVADGQASTREALQSTPLAGVLPRSFPYVRVGAGALVFALVTAAVVALRARRAR